MGDLSKKLMGKSKPKLEPDGSREDEARDDRDDDLTPEEANALKKIQREAKQRGCLLESDGKGGLPPSLVLGIFRRDGWTCKRCGETGTEENGGLSVHHRYQHIQDPKERRKGILANKQGRRNDPSQMSAICARCHDAVHDEDRAENPGQKDADEAMKDGDDDE